MSEVTNLILAFSVGEDEVSCMRVVNDYHYRGLKMNLVSVDHDKDTVNRKSWYGGTKFLEARVYIGAFNHFDLAEFLSHLRTVKWEEPESVQVIVKGPDDAKFRIVEL